MYNRILRLPSATELETTQSIKDIYLYLKQFEEGIEEFAKSKANSIEEVRKKCLTLSTK